MPKFSLSERGKWLATAGEWISRGVACLAGLIIAWRCSNPVRFEQFALERLGRPYHASGIEQQAWIVGSIISAVGAALFIWLMICCARLFHAIKTDEMFGSQTELWLLRLSRVLLLTVVFGILQETLLSIALRLGAGPPRPPVILTLSSEDAISLILAIFLFLFGQIVREGRRARHENSQFV